MALNIKHIIEGWANVVKDRFDLLNDDIKEMASNRILICDECEIRSGGACSTSKVGQHTVTGELKRGCGCFIAAKATIPDSECPLGKW